MAANRHALIERVLVDEPGKYESFADYVEYHGRNTWTLTLEVIRQSDGRLAHRRISMERLSTKGLLELVAERDEESVEAASAAARKAGERSPEGPGPRAQRLLVIAETVGADYCAKQLRKLQHSG